MGNLVSDKTLLTRFGAVALLGGGEMLLKGNALFNVVKHIFKLEDLNAVTT